MSFPSLFFCMGNGVLEAEVLGGSQATMEVLFMVFCILKFNFSDVDEDLDLLMFGTEDEASLVVILCENLHLSPLLHMPLDEKL